MGASVPPTAVSGAGGAPLHPVPDAGEAVQAVSRMLLGALESEGPDAVRDHLTAQIRSRLAVERVLVVALAEREGRATVMAAEPSRHGRRTRSR